jgi:hypothetical protein
VSAIATLFKESLAASSFVAGLSVLVHEKTTIANKKRTRYFMKSFLQVQM